MINGNYYNRLLTSIKKLLVSDPCKSATPPSVSKVCIATGDDSYDWQTSNLLAVVDHETASVYTGQMTILNGPIRGSFLVSSVGFLLYLSERKYYYIIYNYAMLIKLKWKTFGTRSYIFIVSCYSFLYKKNNCLSEWKLLSTTQFLFRLELNM